MGRSILKPGRLTHLVGRDKGLQNGPSHGQRDALEIEGDTEKSGTQIIIRNDGCKKQKGRASGQAHAVDDRRSFQLVGDHTCANQPDKAEEKWQRGENPILAQENPRATRRYWGIQDMMAHHMLTEAQNEIAEQQKSGLLINSI